MDNWILDSAGERVQQQAVFKKRKKKESWQKKKKKSKKIFPDETISFWETQNFSAFFKCTSINFTRAKHAHRRTHNRLLLFCAALWLSSSSRMDVGKNRGREEGAGLIWWGFYLLGRLRVIFRRLTAVSSRAHIKRGKGGNCTLSNLSEYDDGTWKKSSENNIKEISFKKKKKPAKRVQGAKGHKKAVVVMVEGLLDSSLKRPDFQICICLCSAGRFCCRQVLSTGRVGEGGKWCEQNSTGHRDSCTLGSFPAEIHPRCSPYQFYSTGWASVEYYWVLIHFIVKDMLIFFAGAKCNDSSRGNLE